ncbi:MAG: alpha-E domain-containing protein, partial [Pseudomonadota bacterium]
ILSSNSARGGYRMAHGNNPRPREIAHFMILDRRMPRSLAFCISKIRDNLAYLADDYGARKQSHHLADDILRTCAGQDIDVIFNEGLHEFLQDFLRRLGGLARQIEIDYRFTA